MLSTRQPLQLCVHRSIGGRYRNFSYPPSSAIFTVDIWAFHLSICHEMSPSKTHKRVAFNCKEDVVISDVEEEEDYQSSTASTTTNEEEEVPPPVESNNDNNKSSSSSSLSSIGLRKELLRLENLVRCYVQHQWDLSIENYRCRFTNSV